MGLYGALDRPAGRRPPLARRTPTPSTAFQDEALVVLSEIDPALNNSATPSTVDLRDFAPKYFLVNGKAVHERGPVDHDGIRATRSCCAIANAGIQHHSIGVLGLHQRVLAADGSQLPYPRTMVAETDRPRPVGRRPGHDAGNDGGLHEVRPLRRRPGPQQQHAASGIGGMLAFIDASGSAPAHGHRRAGHERRSP